MGLWFVPDETADNPNWSSVCAGNGKFRGIVQWDSYAAAHILENYAKKQPSHFGQTLKPGCYVWSVRAYDEVGKQIAGSETADFYMEQCLLRSALIY